MLLVDGDMANGLGVFVKYRAERGASAGRFPNASAGCRDVNDFRVTVYTVDVGNPSAHNCWSNGAGSEIAERYLDGFLGGKGGGED
jgi:hypothetical protein